jgi:uncharacterized membrane protein
MSASPEADQTPTPEHRWPALIAIAIAVVAYALVPSQIDFFPRWIVPVVTAFLLVPLLIVNPHHFTRETAWSRWGGIGLAILLAVANQAQVVLVIKHLINGGSDAPAVLLTALQVWLTDVIAFALIFWELDRGGPFARRMTTRAIEPDFRFPQEDEGPVPWRPAFFDYLYFSLSNMMAFSPTDVMPLTMRAKALMGVQALTGFVLLALVISRAVNILS